MRLGVFLIAFAFPLILIHGYSEDASVWKQWENWLKIDNFTNVFPISFKTNDQCGSVKEHAGELNFIINKILNDTNSQKVNIVAHSKGGLDARYYVSYLNGSNHVHDLIMLGVPNSGTPAAWIDVTSCQGDIGLFDLQPESDATRSPDQNATHYWTIAGNDSNPCYVVVIRAICYVIPNDGMVEVSSAKSHYESLGVFPYNHTGLIQSREVYERILPILK